MQQQQVYSALDDKMHAGIFCAHVFVSMQGDIVATNSLRQQLVIVFWLQRSYSDHVFLDAMLSVRIVSQCYVLF